MLYDNKIIEKFKLNFTDKDINKYNNNKYLCLDENSTMFIRDYCNNNFPVDIDNYFAEDEIDFFNRNILENQNTLNSSLNLTNFNYYSSAIIIGSSNKKHLEFIKQKLKDNYLIIGINDSLKEYCQYLHLYLNNNAWSNILNFIPNECNEWPRGIFAQRINPRFLMMFKGIKHGYNTPRNLKYNTLLSKNHYSMYLEDHRSILLTCFHLCYILGLKSIYLIDTENYIKEHRPGSIYIKENIYMYPQQILDTSIFSAALYWLNNKGAEIYTYNKDFDIIENLKIKQEDIHD